MSTINLHRPEFFRPHYSGLKKNHQNFQTVSASWTVAMDSRPSQKGNKEDFSMELPKGLVSNPETASLSNLQFDRLQPSEEEISKDARIDFGQFTAREAVLDEEYWTAAWLRAESHWEDRTGERYVENYKRKYTEQEFNSIRRRCKSQLGQRCTCILAVKKNEQANAKHTVLKSVVGTLDLSIRHLLHGETFPGERVKMPLFCSINREGSRYGYISNLCVAKSARRQGIASNMLNFAIRSAKNYGAEQIFVHVHRNNKPAKQLYQKMGFQVFEMASSQLSEEQTHLLCLSA